MFLNLLMNCEHIQELTYMEQAVETGKKSTELNADINHGQELSRIS